MSTRETAKDEYEYICELEELALDAIRTVQVDARDVCIVRTSAGVFAFGTTCPHQGGPMCHGLIKGTMDPSERNEYVFALDGEVVTCPWHGFEFERAGFGDARVQLHRHDFAGGAAGGGQRGLNLFELL